MMYRLAYLADQNERAFVGTHAGRHHDLAAEAFLTLLKRLRKTFLQDSVQWRQRYPRHFLWEHELFSDAEYLEFERQARVTTITRTTNVPHDVRTAIPRLCDLWDMSNQSHSQHHQETSAALAAHGDLYRQILEQLASLNSSSKSIREALQEPRTITIPIQIPPTLPPPGVSNPADLLAHMTEQASALNVLAPSGNCNLQSRVTEPSHRLMESYSMSRSVQTVTDLWREYTIGLNGKPSVKTMYESGERHFGSESERKFYRRRKVILDLVDRIATHRGVPGVEAATAVEIWRNRLPAMSLNKMSETVSKMGTEELLLLSST